MNTATKIITIREDADGFGAEADNMPVVGDPACQEFGMVEFEDGRRAVLVGTKGSGVACYLDCANGIDGMMIAAPGETCGQLVARWLADRGFQSEIVLA